MMLAVTDLGTKHRALVQLLECRGISCNSPWRAKMWLLMNILVYADQRDPGAELDKHV
jgi:hypothetical protein